MTPPRALRTVALGALIGAACAWAPGAHAHEARPAYLALTQTGAETFALVWKVPRLGELVLSVRPRLPPECRDLAPPTREAVAGGLVERRTLECRGGLDGRALAIDGLEATLTDALVRIEFADGRVQTVLLKPATPSLRIDARPAPLAVLGQYLRLGVEHILGGIDHLLFVLGLLLLAQGWRQLVGTITSFTLAHSITLSLAVLGFVGLPGPPVEATIALSILFLARELVLRERGERHLIARAPWLVAFAFGLLHGFGFAGALREIGLPPTEVLTALFAFNAGVEVGQLAFVAATLALGWAVRRALGPRLAPAARLLPWAMGGVAGYWTLARLASL